MVSSRIPYPFSRSFSFLQTSGSAGAHSVLVLGPLHMSHGQQTARCSPSPWALTSRFMMAKLISCVKF